MKPTIHLLMAVVCGAVAVVFSMPGSASPRTTAAAAVPSSQPGQFPPPIAQGSPPDTQALYRTLPGLSSQRPSGGPQYQLAPGHFRPRPSTVGPDTQLPAAGPLTSAAAPSLTVGTTVDGLSNPNGATPPDTQVAVGATEIVEMVNNSAEIWPKSGGASIATLDLNTLFGIPELVGSDPRVLYDAQSGRFFATYISFNPPPYNLFLGNDTTIQILWSLNSAPTGYSDWNGCSYVDTSGQLHDNPALGVSDDKIAIGTDVFSWPAAASDPNLLPLGTDTLLIDKSTALANQTACPSGYFAHVSAGNIRPAQSLGTTSTLYMASLPETGGTTATLWAVTGTVAATNLARVRTDLPMAGTTMPPAAAQAGSSNAIQTNDTRALESVWKSGALIVPANTGCGAPIHACLHLLQIATSSPAVTNERTIAGPSGTDLYFPAVRPDASNNLVVVYTSSSASSYPSVGATALDPTWSAETSITVKAGTAPYTGLTAAGDTSPYRWGDYSGAALDPSDPHAIWVAGEYSGSSTAGAWHTFIARLQTPVLASVGGVAEEPVMSELPPRMSTPTDSHTQAYALAAIVLAGVFAGGSISCYVARKRAPRD